MATENTGRNILVAVDTTDQSLGAMNWAVHEFYKPGDSIHIVHVAKLINPECTIQHGFPGASYVVPDGQNQDKELVDKVRAFLHQKFEEPLQSLNIPSTTHLYLDTNNAPASAIATTVDKVATEIEAILVVLAAHDKEPSFESFMIGSVADYCVRNYSRPTMIVRKYKIEKVA